MLRRLLTEDGAERAFLERLNLFRQNPRLLEQHWNDVGLDVLDVFLSRLFGSETPSPRSGASLRRMELENDSDSVRLARRVDELWTIVEQLQQEVRDLRRQNSALQRQLEMQGEASQMASSVNRMDEVVRRCERRVDHAFSACMRRKPRREGSNPSDSELADSRRSGFPVPKDVTSDIEMVYDFCSEDMENSWICYDFKGRCVAPTSSIIQSGNWASPKSWVIDVSNDRLDGSWKVIDFRHNNRFSAPHVVGEFGVSHKSVVVLRFVRPRQTAR